MGGNVKAGYDMGYHKSECRICGKRVDMSQHLKEDGRGRRLCPDDPDRVPTTEERVSALEKRLGSLEE